MTAASVRSELATAIRVVNLAFGELTPEQQDEVEIVADDVLDCALLDGDRNHALTAIVDWRDRQLAAIEELAQ